MNNNKESFLPYSRQSIDQSDIDNVVKTLKSDFLTTGPNINIFEKKVSNLVNSKFSIAVNSGTSALHIACKALGLGKGDILWTTPTTFVASANCALYCEANVDFVDIESKTGLICTNELEKKLIYAEKINKLPKIVIPVHLGGANCDMKKIFELSKKYGFNIIEDASHSLGAQYNSKLVGGCHYSDITIFSFHPVKIITTGEGGVATTNDQLLASKMIKLRSHGITKDPNEFKYKTPGEWNYEQQILGFNYRMSDIHASLGISQLNKLDKIIEERRNILQRYKDSFINNQISFQEDKDNEKSSVHLAIVFLKNITIENHKNIFSELRSRNIGVQLHYLPIHLHPYYRNLGFQKGDFPKAEKYAQSSFSIPVYPGLENQDQDRVIRVLKELLKKYRQ